MTMDPERWQEVEAIYHAALDRPEAERRPFLREACRGDEELFDEVETLLGFDERGAKLLAKPAPLGGGPQPALSPGSRLGAYEILDLLGAGGMGEVYRARDMRLDRTVALKVLPVDLMQSPERRERFEREARAISRLSHPHICTLYDVGREGDTDFLVMEHLEGESLVERLKRGPLPLEEALSYGVQVAEALGAAHRRGVIHRDLKPANVVLTRAGAMLLDFGLAKLISPAGVVAATPDRPGETAAPATRPGLLLGTLHYMSPEQLEGGPVDARTDVFAFGCLVFEMVTGQRAFRGDTQASVIAAILRGQVPPLAQELGSRGRGLPPGLQAAVDRCLSKDPDERWQAIADVGMVLGDVRRGRYRDASASPAQSRPWPRSRLILAGLLAVTLLPLGWVAWRRARPAGPTTRLSVMVPANRPVPDDICFPCRGLAISPDGTRLVYMAENLDAPPGAPGASWQLQLRSLTTLEVLDLRGTSGGSQPFFSPDGRWVAFFTGTGELKKLSLSGGNPITLLEGLNGSRWSFGVWTEEGTIVFDTRAGGLASVSAEGGQTTVLTSPDASAGESSHRFPALVPGGRALLFTVGYRDSDRRQIQAVVRNTGERRIIIENAHAARVLASGHLLFQRDQAIMIAPFDLDRLIVTGSAVPLVDAVQFDNTGRSPMPLAQLAVSRTGTLAYVPVADRLGTLGLVGRNGTFEPVGLIPGHAETPRVAPDGRAVAFVEARGSRSEARIYTLARGSTAKLGSEGRVRWLAWHPDGRSVAVGADGGIVSRSLDGSEELLVPAREDVRLRDFSWSPDGRRLAYTTQNGSQYDIWVTTFGESPTTAPLLASAAREYGPSFSPDGRWLAYGSDESGREEVYLRRFPSGERFVVSTGGGFGPVWSPDGREIYFQGFSDGTEKLFGVSVATADGNGLRLGAPVPLFDLRAPGPTGVIEEYVSSSISGITYDILPDGQRFLMVKRAAEPSGREIVLVQNWFEELKQLAPNGD